jgi:hypothetical protein
MEHLKAEAALYKDLIEILRTETDNLVNRDYKGLYDTVCRKEHILVKIDSMGEVRKTLLTDVSASLGIDGFVNLSAVIELLTGRERDELKGSQGTVLSLINSILEIKKVNAILSKGSLDNMNKALVLHGGFMLGQGSRSGPYSCY